MKTWRDAARLLILRSCAALTVMVAAGGSMPARAIEFGGPAPIPICWIPTDRTSIGGIVCSEGHSVLGAPAAAQDFCAIYARGHNALGTGGSWLWSCAAASTVQSCAVQSPAIPPNMVGVKGTTIGVNLQAQDVIGTRSWSGGYNGPYCECQANAMLTSEATCACPAGMSWNEQTGSCGVQPYAIALSGRSSTKALIAGPALVQVAKVTQNGAPVAGRPVSVKVTGGASFGGVTNAAGEFVFTYVPPYTSTVDHLTGTCTGCANTAEKDITVESCDTCTPGFGNPIQPSTGEKQQDEVDWQDGSPHPLSFIRQYRSLNNIEAGLGLRWSHNFAATIQIRDLDATVRFGDGSKVIFVRDNATAAWVAENYKDGLSQTATGLLYYRAADESRWQFDETSRLVSIRQRNGWMAVMGYNSGGQLASVTNAFGRSLQFSYNAGGKLATVVTPDGRQITYGYDSSGRLLYATAPDGTSQTYRYEDSRWPIALTGIVDETGAPFASFTYDDTGRATGTQHAGAQNYRMTYPAGYSSKVGALVAGNSVDPNIYRMTAQVNDPLGSARSYTWIGGDGRIQLLGGSGPFDGDQLAARSLNALNLPESESDFLGVLTTYTWDLARVLKTSTTKAAGRPEAQTTTTQWHASFRLPELVTEPGRTTAYVYDNLGNTTSETSTDLTTGQTRTWRWTYNTQGLAATMTDPKGGVWNYGYDGAGNRTSVRNALGQTSTFVFDGSGRVSSETGPNGLLTAYGYDLRGRLTSLNIGGEVSTFSYTTTGQLANAVLPNGYQVTYSYDPAQRLTGLSDNRGAVIEYTLDGMGNRVGEKVKDATGNIVLAVGRVMNSLNRVLAIQGAAGQTTSMSYDANGQPLSVTDPLQQATRQTLDGLRRPVTTTFADNSFVGQGWNGLDQQTHVVDPKGVQTTYQTNAFGDVMSETSTDIGTVVYTRDANGDVTGIQDAKGNISRIERDALGRPTSILYAQGHEVTYSYDAAGHVIRVDDRSGSTAYVRDAQGRVLGKTQTVNDNPSNPTRLGITYSYEGGELASIGYPSGLKVFYRRAAGRITAIDVREPASISNKNPPVTGFVSNLTHNALGQPNSWTWKSGDSANRSFDTDGRMTHSEIASYSYDAASRIVGITQTLSAQRTVTQVVGTTTVIATELFSQPITWTAGYDSRNRLTSFTRAGASTAYSYDTNSNRLTSVDTSSSETDLEAAFDAPNFTKMVGQNLNIDAASNKLLGFSQTLTTTQAGTTINSMTTQVSFSFDSSGAMTSDGLRTFDYDESRRLIKVRIFKDSEAAAVNYLHNAGGERVFKSQPQVEQILPDEEDLGPGFINWLKRSFGWLFLPSTAAKASVGTTFVYDEGGKLLGEYDNGSAAGKGRTEYIWLPVEGGQMMPIGVYRNDKFYQVHPDHLGTPRLVTDNTNKVLWQWPYSAFGNNKPTGVLSATTGARPTFLGTKATFEINLRFAGQYFDAESNLAYNYRRSYRPTEGRFTQPDPIGLGGGLNRYGYTFANPLANYDPTGEAVPLAVCLASPICAAAAVATFVATLKSCVDVANSVIKQWVSKDEVAPDEADGKKDVTKRPSRVRKGTEQANWDNAEDGTDDSKLCSTCDREVTSRPGEKGKDWDNDHLPPWRDRDLTGKDRKGVLDEYNNRTRLRCVHCNRSDNGK